VFTARIGVCVLVLTLGSATVHPLAGAAEPNPLSTLVGAAVERLLTADPVAAFKWQTKADIEDPGRVDQVLAAVTADALAGNIDPGYVSKVFRDQINATEAIEYGRFAQWKLDPDGAPPAAPDLSSSRAQIDALNHLMVTEITTQWALLHSPECAAARGDAVGAAVEVRQLDSLYRQSLDFATRSYCQPPV
jgi:chorismate mutase